MKLKVFIVLILVSLLFVGCNTGTDVDEPKEEVNENKDAKENKNEDNEENVATASALYIGLIDNNFSELKLINTDDNYNAFAMTDEVKEKINNNNYPVKTLVEISYLPRDKENPLISEIKKIEETKTKAKFKGMADANFAEFEVYNNMWVFKIADDLKDKFSNMEIDNSITIKIRPGKVAKANMIVFDIEE